MHKKKVNIDAVETGDVLAADVTDRNGRLLLHAGQRLEHRHVSIFRSWGVAQVDIVSAPNNHECPKSSHESSDAGSMDPDVLLRFGKNDTGHPLISELLRICADSK